MKNRKKYIIILVVIILLQVVLKIYNGNNKKDYFMDEIYSYGLMNYTQAYIFEKDDFIDNWHEKEYFDDYITISENEALDWSTIYTNQMKDFHPPLYYILLRCASSLTIGQFTKWTGLALNIVIFIICAIVLYKIGNHIFKDKKLSLLLVFLYGFSKFSAENALFIRMYQLLELQILLLLNWNIRNHNNEKIELKEYIKLIVLITLGTLTHYYYIIFLIGVAITNILKYIKRKQIKNILKYILVIIIAQIIIIGIFPGYIEHINKNFTRCNDGQVEQEEETEIVQETKEEKNTSIVNREKLYISILDNNMFYMTITYLLVGLSVIIIVVVIVKKYKKCKLNIKLESKIMHIIIPTIFYWLIVTSTSPYIDIRYILPIIVMFLILIMYIVEKTLIICKQHYNKILCIFIIISLIYVIPIGNNTKLEYQYLENEKMIEKITTYKEIPCVYMYEEQGVLENIFMLNFNYVRQFDKVYIMNYTKFDIEKLEEELEKVDISKGIIIYDNMTRIDDTVNKIIENIPNFTKYKRIMRIIDGESSKGAIVLVY